MASQAIKQLSKRDLSRRVVRHFRTAQGLKPFTLLDQVRSCAQLSDSQQVQREIEILQQLNHPSILRLYQVLNDPESTKLYLGIQCLRLWLIE